MSGWREEREDLSVLSSPCFALNLFYLLGDFSNLKHVNIYTNISLKLKNLDNFYECNPGDSDQACIETESYSLWTWISLNVWASEESLNVNKYFCTSFKQYEKIDYFSKIENIISQLKI